MFKVSDRKLIETAIAFGIRVASAGLLYGLQVLLARTMDLEGYGYYVTLWTWIIALGSFAALGFPDSSVRFLPRYRSRGREGDLVAYWRFGLLAVVLASAVLAALAVAISRFIGASGEVALVAIYVAIGLPFLAIENYLEGICRSLGWFRLTTVAVYIVRPVLIGAACLTWIAAGRTLGIAAVGCIVIGAMALISAALVLVIARRLSSGARRPRPPSKRRMLWLKASAPLLLVSGLEDLLTNSDVLLLSLLMPAQDVGIYFAAARTLALANFVYFAVYLVSGRGFALALADADKARLQHSVLETTRMSFWFTLLALVVTLAAGPWLLRAFGANFVSGYGVMLILAAGLLVRSLAGQAGELLIVSGRQRESILIGAGMLVANVILTAALIPVFGVHGAAAGTALAMVGRTCALIVAVRKTVGLRVVSVVPSFEGARGAWGSSHSPKPR